MKTGETREGKKTRVRAVQQEDKKSEIDSCRNTTSNRRLPASRPSPNSPISCVMHELSLGLVLRALFRIRIHDARESCRQRWSIRPLPRRIRSLHRGMRVHELELLVSLYVV